jgi:putative flippase GtrA
MDVDLSTDLSGLFPLVAPLLSGHSDLAVGSRLANGARVQRGLKREIISRGYNLLLHATLRTNVSDAQCGFKAIRRDRAMQLLPLVEDRAWFFDTELLVLAERAGLRIHEVPVDWIDDPDSRVDIVTTAIDDLRGIARLLRARRSGELRRQVGRFVGVGVLSTLAYVLLYALLRQGVDPFAANAVALLTTALGNTAANRSWTFGVTGRDGQVRHQAQGLVVFATALLITTLSLAALRGLDPGAGRHFELAVLVMANLVATAVRFVALRQWVFRPGLTGHSQGSCRIASEP